MKSRDLNLLPILERLIATQSLTVSAKELGMSVPAVSRALARLRDEYGDELLVRSGRGMRLTPRAERMYPPLKESLSHLEAISYPSESLRIQDVERCFKVRCDDVFAGVLAQEFTRLFVGKAPGIEIELVSEGASSDTDLREGSVDLEIGGRANFSPETVVRKLGYQSIVALTKREHPLKKGRVTAKRLFGFPHVLAGNQRGHEAELLSALKSLALIREANITVPSYYSAAVVVSQSHMIATMPEVMARHLSELFGLAVVPLQLKLKKIQASVAWHSSFRQDPVHQWLRTEIADLIIATIVEKKKDK